MNFNQATFKSVVIVSLLGAAILPPPFLVAATAVSESKYGPPESEGRGGFGGEGSSLLLFEQVNKVAGTKDHDVGNIGKGGKALDVVIGGGHDANQVSYFCLYLIDHLIVSNHSVLNIHMALIIVSA